MLKEESLTLKQYINFLIQLHYYIVPGPKLLADDIKRINAEDDIHFKRYLEAHFEIENTLIPLILTDLNDLGVSEEDVKRIGPTKETEQINQYVHKLHHDPDPVLILVSDIAAKVLLDHYTSRIIEVIKPKLPNPSKGVGFLTKDTKAQIDIKAEMLEIMKKRINFKNKKLFISELRKIFDMFKNWLEVI